MTLMLAGCGNPPRVALAPPPAPRVAAPMPVGANDERFVSHLASGYAGRGKHDALDSRLSDAYGGGASAGIVGLYGLRAQGASGSHTAALFGAERRLPPLDPNGRYATTYRPGGAALAAFEAALARGAIPAGYRTLVGDFGARYAPPIAPPDEAALAFRVDLGRVSPSAEGGRVPLRVAIRSSARRPERARLAVHLVLDNSGSMIGEAIDNARHAASALVARLADDDEFSLTIFSSDAEVVVDAGRVRHRRQQIAEAIKAIGIGGSTNIDAGLAAGYAEARRSPADAVRIVMLLSDGHANMGTDGATLAGRVGAAFEEGIQTSAFGLGADYDAALMSAVADRGAGGYYYLADSSQIASALDRELDARVMPVAQAIEVRIRLAPDVQPLKVYGSHLLAEDEAAAVRRQEVAVDVQSARRDGIARDRQRDERGGMRLFIPTFARDDRHATVVDLQVPRDSGARPLGTVEIRYKDRLRRQNVVEELPLRAGTADVGVERTVEAFAAGDAILRAATQIQRGETPVAALRLEAAATRLNAAATRLDDIRLAADARRLTALASAVKARTTGPLPLAVLLRGSGYGYLH